MCGLGGLLYREARMYVLACVSLCVSVCLSLCVFVCVSLSLCV
jgi:hypothetical protein